MSHNTFSTSRSSKKSTQRRLERLLREDEERYGSTARIGAFFKQNPHRHYHMRLATPGEIAAMLIANGGAPLPLPADALLWAVTKLIAPGRSVCKLVQAPLPPGPLNDIPEHIAREVFNSAAGE